MKKTTIKDRRLAVFINEFNKYQTKLGLTNYKVYFQREKLSDCYADITVDHRGMVATVRVSDDANVKESAKHEALHLLISKLEERALDRHSTYDDIYKADEEIVRRLEKVL